MTEIRNYDTPDQVATAAAENAIEILQLAIEQRGLASWVLAGGSSPLLAYQALANSEQLDQVDWSKVTILIGDERFVDLADKDSNWGTIIKFFDENDLLTQVKRLVPDVSQTVELAAKDYQAKISSARIKKFDLVWIGVGEDGHTLSLFPNNPAFTEATKNWVVPVYDSPKPPAERFSLSLTAMEHVDELVIFAVGETKRAILRQARMKRNVPVAVVADIVETAGGEVRWIYDDAAWDND